MGGRSAHQPTALRQNSQPVHAETASRDNILLSHLAILWNLVHRER